MNKNEIVDVYDEANKKIEEDIGLTIPSLLVSVSLTVFALKKAHRAAKGGNYPKAIYYLIMWHSYKMSTDSAILRHKVSKSNEAPKIKTTPGKRY